MQYIEVAVWVSGIYVFEQEGAARRFENQEQAHTYLGQRNAHRVSPGTGIEGTYQAPTPFVPNIAVK